MKHKIWYFEKYFCPYKESYIILVWTVPFSDIWNIVHQNVLVEPCRQMTVSCFSKCCIIDDLFLLDAREICSIDLGRRRCAEQTINQIAEKVNAYLLSLQSVHYRSVQTSEMAVSICLWECRGIIIGFKQCKSAWIITHLLWQLLREPQQIGSYWCE